MKKLKLKLCNAMIRHYERRWKNAIDKVKELGREGVITDEYRKWSSLTAKYGKKSLLWINKKEDITREPK